VGSAIVPAAEGVSEMVLAEEATSFERPVVETLLARPFRDAAFSRAVLDAYEGTCAVSGLRIRNGMGRVEAQAAHIRPVSKSGPDSVRNGLALSGTVHWMFGRGIVSLDSDYKVIVARGELPPEMIALIRPGHQIELPRLRTAWPAQPFLDYHRQCIFKG
jgi:putative restriction endonuclease